MEANALENGLRELEKLAALVAARRGEHAAALWAVSDVLAALPAGGLAPFQDDEPLADGSLLAVRQVDPGGPAEGGAGLTRPFWALCVLKNGTVLPAYEASPEVAVAAVRRLGTFLAGYGRFLQLAAGSRTTRTQAQEVLQAVTAVVGTPCRSS